MLEANLKNFLIEDHKNIRKTKISGLLFLTDTLIEKEC